jgi:hypothetical protein
MPHLAAASAKTQGSGPTAEGDRARGMRLLLFPERAPHGGPEGLLPLRGRSKIRAKAGKDCRGA